MREVLISGLKSSRLIPAPARAAAHRHTVSWLTNPDPEGPFAQKTRYLRRLPSGVALSLLRLCRYDGLVFLHREEDKVLGHEYFQGHRDGLHLFAVWVTEELRGSDTAVRMVRAFLVHAWIKDWDTVRLGTDRNPAMRRLRERAFSSDLNLPFRLTPGTDGWAKIN